MDKKVFYGEYTLMHWIELIQRENIVLPEYQRCFVWDLEQVENFINSLKQGCFIPPIIIGAFQTKNLIIDGQQRLTTLLLCYLGRMPKRDVFKITDDPNYVDMDEGVEIPDGADSEPIGWTFKLILKHGSSNSKADLLSIIDGEQHDKYDMLPARCSLDDDFLNSSYLGFSYIVPSNTPGMENEQVKFYSTVFHDINMQGVELMAQESRRSLYYLDTELVHFFEPEISKSLKVIQNGKTARYDFVRALAFSFQYAKQKDARYIAKKCRRQEAFEQYYSDFINKVILDEDSSLFGKFSFVVGKAHIQKRMENLNTYVDLLGYRTLFRTIIEADTNLIGLIYYTVIKNCKLDDTRFLALKSDLSAKIADYEGDDGHKRSPNSVTYLRKRINDSIQIYSHYLHV